LDFGIAGMADAHGRTGHSAPGPLVPNTIRGNMGITPALRMADGGTRRTMFINKPSVSTQSVMTSDFWRYDRLAHELYLPDGTICSYDPTTGRLAEIRDPFTEDNRVTLTWTPNLDGLTVVQHLGTESRTNNVRNERDVTPQHDDVRQSHMALRIRRRNRRRTRSHFRHQASR